MADEENVDAAAGDEVKAAEFPDLEQAVGEGGVAGTPNLDLIRDIGVTLRVELGRTDMMIAEVLELSPGQVIELDKLAGEPLDIMINDKLLARGEVVVVDEKFGVRITSILDPRSRVQAMGADGVAEPGPQADSP
ncbi:MAG: flagellar motor switch protein FliN [Planctomycetota bacterium]|jgi:flagellar motor switch protein FliN/FliY|nr:flagellar motor switch protein FliN [Planctomycetota bacterium]